jgi:hypothetical protein
MNLDFTPGTLVRNPAHPEWGVGQVQSAVGGKVTANFENAGKLTLNLAVVTLETLDEPPQPPGSLR